RLLAFTLCVISTVASLSLEANYVLQPSACSAARFDGPLDIYVFCVNPHFRRALKKLRALTLQHRRNRACERILSRAVPVARVGSRPPAFIRGEGGENDCRFPAEAEPGSGRSALREGPVGQPRWPPAGLPQPRDLGGGDTAGGRGRGADPKGDRARACGRHHCSQALSR